ncbi:MAG: hypothetical protein WCG44_03145 [bacterium]
MNLWDKLSNSWSKEQIGSPSMKFYNALVIELAEKQQLDLDQLMSLSGPISGTHLHQSEIRGNKHSFFELIDEDYAKLIRPAYLAVKTKFEKQNEQFVDLDDPETSGTYKEFSSILEGFIKTKMNY